MLCTRVREAYDQLRGRVKVGDRNVADGVLKASAATVAVSSWNWSAGVLLSQCLVTMTGQLSYRLPNVTPSVELSPSRERLRLSVSQFQ